MTLEELELETSRWEFEEFQLEWASAVFDAECAVVRMPVSVAWVEPRKEGGLHGAAA
jgi:hypothetical protein